MCSCGDVQAGRDFLCASRARTYTSMSTCTCTGRRDGASRVTARHWRLRWIYAERCGPLPVDERVSVLLVPETLTLSTDCGRSSAPERLLQDPSPGAPTCSQLLSAPGFVFRVGVQRRSRLDQSSFSDDDHEGSTDEDPISTSFDALNW